MVVPARFTLTIFVDIAVWRYSRGWWYLSFARTLNPAGFRVGRMWRWKESLGFWWWEEDLRVQGLGFRVQDAGFKVQGLRGHQMQNALRCKERILQLVAALKQ